MIKKVLVIQAVLVSCVAAAFAANPFDNFNGQLAAQADTIVQERLDTFTKDIGFLLGGSSYHKGNVCGFPGFDVGVRAAFKETNKDNSIIKSAGVDTIALPIVQVEIGLPASIDLIGRAMSYADASVVGGGLRYGIFKNTLPVMPNLSVQGTYTMLNVSTGANKLKATTMSVSAMASFNIPIADPYIGVGIDQTTVTPDETITKLTGKATTTRIEAGVNLTLFPFTYLQVGGTMMGSEMGYTAGLGVKF